MKRKNIIAFSVALMAIGAFTSCSDEFLQDKKNYDYVDASTYNTFSGAKARVDDIYAWCLPNTSSDPSWKYNTEDDLPARTWRIRISIYTGKFPLVL